MARRTRICVFLALLVALSAPAAYAADVVPSVSPTVLQGAGPWTITYKIQFEAGATDELVSLKLFGGGFVVPDPTVDGPGTLVSTGRYLASSALACAFGSDQSAMTGGGSYNLVLPPGTQTTLTITVPISHSFAPGEDRVDDLTVQVDGNPLVLPSPALDMPRAVPISVRAPSGPVAVGRRVWIKGKTSPDLAGQSVELLAAHSTSAKYVSKPQFTTRVGRARVARNGSFAYRWRPPSAGRWGFQAAYRSHDPRFLDSASSACTGALQVGPSRA